MDQVDKKAMNTLKDKNLKLDNFSLNDLIVIIHFIILGILNRYFT